MLTDQRTVMNWIVADASKRSVLEARVKGKHTHRRIWSETEDQFLRDHLGYLTDAEMAKELNRTEIAVHLRWDRDLRLPGPSKAPNILTAHEAAKLIGIDGHKTTHWVDAGLIPGRTMAGGRNIRLIEREALKRWVLNPDNWIYFKIDKVPDPTLKRLLKKRARRWGDAWWTTRRVADYHGVDTGDVKRYIQHGKIQARQITVSYGGRHPHLSWKLCFVLKSEATRSDLVFITKGKGSPDMPRLFTPAALKWIVKARDKHKMKWDAICRTMKMPESRAYIVSVWYARTKKGRGRTR